MSIDEIYQIFCNYPLAITDSRAIVKDSIFFALKGDRFNGNQYAEAALEKGCAYAVIDQSEYAKGDRYILVDNVLATLQELARLHRRTLGIPILAITGTNGKTTTKELVNAVLSRKFISCATKGNLNNHIGVPLTLLSMDKSTEFGVVEMGANHPGEIKELCGIAEPDYGVITNVGIAHLEGFGSFQGVKATKKELYDYLNKADGTVFVNGNNSHLMGMLNKQKFLCYGDSDDFFSRGRFLQAQPYMVMEMRSPVGKLYVKTKLFGAYNFENALAAVTIGRFFEIDEVVIKEALESYEPQNNRSQIRKTGKNVLFMDAYNANPTSMRAAIENFAGMSSKKKIVILGDMLELGDDSDQQHKEIMSLLSLQDLSDVILVGSNFSSNSQYGDFRYFENVDMLRSFLEQEKIENTYILIKGSRGIGLEKAIDLL